MQILRQVIFNSFPAEDKHCFDIRLALPAFISWDMFQAERRRKQGIVTIEENWKAFSKMCKTADREEFKRIFEYCMIDVMSEALAETLGSIMNL